MLTSNKERQRIIKLSKLFKDKLSPPSVTKISSTHLSEIVGHDHSVVLLRLDAVVSQLFPDQTKEQEYYSECSLDGQTEYKIDLTLAMLICEDYPDAIRLAVVNEFNAIERIRSKLDSIDYFKIIQPVYAFSNQPVFHTYTAPHCSICNEFYEGDGYHSVMHCPNADESTYAYHEPDANPVDCIPLTNEVPHE